jgi:hypothetical protein
VGGPDVIRERTTVHEHLRESDGRDDEDGSEHLCEDGCMCVCVRGKGLFRERLPYS